MSIKKALLFLALITFAVYFSAFWNQFVWDDEQFIYSNGYVQSFALKEIFTTSTTAGAGVQSNYYRPLATLSFAIDHLLWDLQPVGFHLTNLSLHIAAGLLLFLILKRLRLSTNMAFVIALIFCIHPIQTEAVTYINSRGDSLFAFFGFLSLYVFCISIEKKAVAFQIAGITFSLSRWVLGSLVALFYLCSILAKEIGIVFGGLLFISWLLMVYQLNGASNQTLLLVKALKKQQFAILSLIVCALIGGMYLYLRATTLNFQNSFDFYNDASVYSQSIAVRLLTFTHVFFIYLRLLSIPYPLHMERSIEVITSLRSIWPWLFVITNLALWSFAIRELRKQKPLALFSLLWFCIALLPVSGIIPINGILYEHWLYIPMVGFFLFLFTVIRSLPTKLQYHIADYKMWLLVPLFMIYAVLTIRQNYFWSTPIRLYNYLLRYTESGRIHNNLAMAYADDNQYALALHHYDEALSFGDVYPQIHHNKGNLYRSMGDLPAAIPEFLRAIEMAPNFVFSYQLLLATYIDLGEYDHALALITQAENVFVGDSRWQQYRAQLNQLLLAQPAGSDSTGSAPAASTSASPATR